MFRLCLPLLLLCTGCSVILAASGSDEPDLSILQAGASQGAIERELGRPTSYTKKSHGDEAVYQYVTNDQASYARAAGYLALDIVTAFIAEIFTFPVEAVQGDRHTVVINYNLNRLLQSAVITDETSPLEAPNPEQMIGLTESKETT